VPRPKRRNDPPQVVALRIACVFAGVASYLALNAAGVSGGYAALAGLGIFLLCTIVLTTWERRQGR
jgi:hypothetical protein